MKAGSTAPGGHLAENILFFGRTLRMAGMQVGPGAMLDAVAAAEAIGIGDKAEFRAALQAVFVTKRQDAELFDQAFRLFFRRRHLLEKMMAQLMPIAPTDPSLGREEALRRVSEALFGERPPDDLPEQVRRELDARLTVSDSEILQTRDFEQMSAAEIAAARQAIARLELPLQRVKTRRFRADPAGPRPDPRATLRASLRGGGAAIELRRRAPAIRTPPLVALCDISGSMAGYTPLFLHFLHVLAQSGRRVHAFTFATELTHVTRALKANRDPDLALGQASKLVKDWDGGTRLAKSLAEFNKSWARRVLGQGAIVLLITDGLERRVTEALPRELARLRRSCRRLIWLNPLLRFEGFEAKASGIAAMLPHVDEFRTLHNLASMADLCDALRADRSPEADPRRFLKEFAT